MDKTLSRSKMIGTAILMIIMGAIISLTARVCYPAHGNRGSRSENVMSPGERTYKSYTHDSKGITGFVADVMADSQAGGTDEPLVRLVDSLGGISVSLSDKDIAVIADEKVGSQPVLRKGDQTLDGIQAAAYSRNIDNADIICSQLENKCAGLSKRQWKILVRRCRL